ncbi:phospholipid-transporting ATPase [Pseudozyma hubeiensis SY62]|uniref:Phospholipid-transporting ATPase n=1 Tax=Pseudozyma hubeiensis (strain SY62) TaxID=1305764 RepID=R9P3X3_PSEHS|nr:phospholipid-transporting ATPase [Pseudozyma hubeiensis SY62]GAC96148.1 phospholipid-transporting ATPase [Pseudozyma hubeiensis SY62]
MQGPLIRQSAKQGEFEGSQRRSAIHLRIPHPRSEIEEDSHPHFQTKLPEDCVFASRHRRCGLQRESEIEAELEIQANTLLDGNAGRSAEAAFDVISAALAKCQGQAKIPKTAPPPFCPCLRTESGARRSANFRMVSSAQHAAFNFSFRPES